MTQSRRLVLSRSATLIAAASTGLLLPEIVRAQGAKVRVGLMLPYTGTFAQLGVAIENGLRLAIDEQGGKLGGREIEWFKVDDESDPSKGVENATKLVQRDKVDVIIGPSNTPAAQAVAPVAASSKTPDISVSPVALGPAEAAWTIAIPQPGDIWIMPIIRDMQKRGVKKAAFIGFNDPWGDLCWTAFKAAAAKAGIEIVAEERYARADNSVTGQILRIITKKPDAVFVGASGTPGVLPHLALAERKFTGPAYGTPAVFNQDFLRLGGAAVDGVMAVTGPIGAYTQLPDSNPIKAVSASFVKAYEAANGAGSSNGFAAYSHDAMVIFENAAAKALKVAKPGTPEFRQALRDAIRDKSETVGTQGVYSFKDGSPYGVDERSVVLVRVENGAWKLVP